ncbi:TRAP transporter small permease [Streptomyces sp. Amel2xB2]|uniref:TRAP transporter small permease n=1 Tax=Streptomyces sp. Amel2xB2 TaxID=1305829 RepID=UPI0015EBB30E|nr:TRAP transporter small permease [Streptomyces sp. Amel2xB2]
MTALNSLRTCVLACALALAVVAMAVVGLMMLTIAYDVVVRFVFAAPTDWAYPLNSAGVLASTALALPYFYAKGQHISMDLIHRGLPAGARRAADLVTAAATAFLGVVLAVTAYRSMTVAIAGGLTGSGTFTIPLWIPDAVLFLSGVLLAVVAVLFPPPKDAEGLTAAVEGAPDAGTDARTPSPAESAEVPSPQASPDPSSSTEPPSGTAPETGSGTAEGEARS